MNGLKYSWTVIQNLIVLFIIMGVYDVISTSFEIIVVSVCILIYFQVIAGFAGMGWVSINQALLLDRKLNGIRKLIDKSDREVEEEQELRLIEENLKPTRVKFYINVGFSFLFFIIAIINILGAI